MTKTFYEYLMTLRDPDNYEEIAQFANNAFFDISFPKRETDFHKLTQYLELNGNYLPNMQVFDDVWQLYLESKQEEL